MPKYRYPARSMPTANCDLRSRRRACAGRRRAAWIERLGLVLVDNVTPDEGGAAGGALSIFNRPTTEDVTIFTRDLALLLRAGARINDGLELLAADPDFGRLRSVVADIRARVVSGDSFGEALARHEGLFPAMMYIALVRVGEASGSLDQVLERALAGRTARAARR